MGVQAIGVLGLTVLLKMQVIPVKLEVDILINCQNHLAILLRRSLLLALLVLLTASIVRADNQTQLSYLQRVPVIVDKESVYLQMRIYRPVNDGKLPTLVLNHGSTGSGIASARFKQPVDMPAVASFFVQRGWAVVIPARRGRAGSGGKYDEGFSIIRALGYSCFPSRSIAGADRALRDIEAAMTAIFEMPFVDQACVAIGGVSRGGALSIAYAGTHPTQVRAVINFVGGWIGWPCPTMSAVNRILFNRGATYPGKSIWLYADNDSYYSLSHSRKNFSVFTAAGGRGIFYEYVVPAGNGHWLPAFPALWEKDLEAYLLRMGLPGRKQHLISEHKYTD
jgi:pimeloyl-ACP methyl ester carboxylesterase